MRRSFFASVVMACVACGGSDATTIGESDAGDASSRVDATTDGGGGSDASTDALPPVDASDASPSDAGDGGKLPVRLFVAGKGANPGGVFVWDDPDAITTAVAPTTTLTDPSIAGGSVCLALAGKRLFVGLETGNSSSATALVAFDGADTVSGAAAPAAKIPVSSFIGGNPKLQRLFPARGADLLFTESFSEGSQLFTSASTMTSASTAKAKFNHAFQQTPGVAYDATGDRLFLGQISGAGLLAWNAAGTKTGSPTNDFATTGVNVWDMALAQNRLYAGGSTTNGGVQNAVMVWTNVGGFTASTAPTFAMTGASGINGFVPDVAVSANDVLVVTLQTSKVNLYAGASTLTGDKAPTASATTNLNQPKRAILSKTDRLYVLDTDGIAVFKTASTTPTFVAKLKVPGGAANDIALLE
jgi:hypothetical protein